MSTTSPFKFLDAYDKTDKDIFFGRDEEVKKLYELVFQSNLTLVYGQSGTGKTSLVQCGLANRFAQSDWFNIYIRRNEDINVSMLNALKRYRIPELRSNYLLQRLKQKRQGTKMESSSAAVPEQLEANLTQTLERLYKHYLKPIYLIFDQFEELYILGNKSEEESFYQNIADILSRLPYCHVIIIMREEHIAQLYNFEKMIDHLFDKRLRVERMSRVQTEEVIVRTASKFEIQLENETIPGQVIDALNEGQGRVELTYLQVFLDRLYQAAATQDGAPVKFTSAIIQKAGGIADVLRNFLSIQRKRIQAALQEQYPEVPTNVVAKTLSHFVSIEGTKRPLLKDQINASQLTVEQLDFILAELEKGRILRFENDRYEISHDRLAEQVFKQRSANEKSLLQIVKMIHDRYRTYEKTKTPLQSGELLLIYNFKTILKEENSLSSAEWAFVEKSQRQKIIKVFLAAALVVGLFVGLMAFSYYSNKWKDDAETKLKIWEEANYNRFLETGKAKMAINEFTAATNDFQMALQFDSLGEAARTGLSNANNKLDRASTFQEYMSNGDKYHALKDETLLVYARNEYQKALALDFDNQLANNKLLMIRGELDIAFEKFKSEGDRFEEKGNYQKALENYRHADRIKLDEQIKIRIKELVKTKIEQEVK